jgi:hypothetical protein
MEKRAASHGEINHETIVNLPGGLMDASLLEDKRSAGQLFHAGRLRLFIKRGSPPIYRDQLDYEVIEDARAIGRIYEDLHALPEFRWLR